MYEALEKITKKFKASPSAPEAMMREQENLNLLCAALNQTAQELDAEARTSTSPTDSSNLAKLYQGMLATKRVIENLAQEGREAALAQLMRQDYEGQGTSLTAS